MEHGTSKLFAFPVPAGHHDPLPKAFFPIANGGDAAILYCLIFLYFALAGGGPWTIATLFGRPAGERQWHSAHAAR